MADPHIALGTFASTDGKPFPGLLVAGHVHPVAALLAADAAPGRTWPTMRDILDDWDHCWPRLERSARALSETSTAVAIPRESLAVLTPVQPRQIVCAGANYRRHVIEIMTDHDVGSEPGLSPGERRRRAEAIMDHRAAEGQPFAFVKPVSALLDPFGTLAIPADSGQTDWELELAVVIGRLAYRVRRENAFDHVAGYSIANDISARDRIARRDIPNLGLDWIAGKSAPGFLPLGPYIVPAALAGDPQSLTITLTLNGERMQHDTTADMIFPVARLIEHVSTYMRLLPGDILCTGSPAGNGTHFNRFLRPGDTIEGSISGLGMQRTSCVEERVTEAAALHRPFAPLPEERRS